MFKLILVAAFVAVATAKPGYVTPVLSSVVHQKTIESHGNSIVHSSAPVVHSVHAVPAVHAVHAVPVVQTHYVQPAKRIIYEPAVSTLVAEKTVSNHGHSVVHGAPLLQTVHAAYAPNVHYF